MKVKGRKMEGIKTSMGERVQFNRETGEKKKRNLEASLLGLGLERKHPLTGNPLEEEV